MAVRAEQDLSELQESARSVNDAKALLEREHTRDEKGLQAASSDWHRLNHLVDEWIYSDPTRDQLPLKEKERDHQQYLLDVILRNQSTFTAQSAYLDAFLVFVSISLLWSESGKPLTLNGVCRLVCSQPSSPLSHKNLERFARRPLKDTPGAPEFDYITAIPTDSGIHLGEWSMVFKSRCQSLCMRGFIGQNEFLFYVHFFLEMVTNSLLNIKIFGQNMKIPPAWKKT